MQERPSAIRAVTEAGSHAVQRAGAALIDSLIDEMPQALRLRPLLSKLDWAAASAAQLERLFCKLEAARREPPSWLTSLAIMGGHSIPARLVSRLPLETQALALLNGARSAQLPAEIEVSLMRRLVEAQLDPDVTSVLIDRLAALGADELACRLALAILPERPEAIKTVRRSLDGAITSMPSIALGVAGFVTTETMIEALRPAFASVGLNARMTAAPFGTALSELMQPRGDRNGVIVVLDPHSLLATDWRNSAEQRAGAIEQRIDALCDALAAHCRLSGAPVLINTLGASVAPYLGHYDTIDASGAAAAVRRVNEKLAQVAASLPAVQLIDADQALRSLAPDMRHDHRLWLYGRIAFSEPATRKLAAAFARAWIARKEGPAKVLALDLDNTLWGGVFGDDGIGRLACGDDPPGNAYKALQEECLRLKSQGMLLVALSKNNPDAIEVFSNHPGMALRPDDFAAVAINWEHKADNIRRLARELNLGLDSFVFLDDSPHEREAMRRLCPEVRVPEMPADPAARPDWLRQLPLTWALRPTEEDARRTDLYRTDRAARALRESSGTYEDYLTGLAQKLEVEPVSETTIGRVAQLHQRTNQFNLTNLRLTEADIARAMSSPEPSLVLLGRAADRFGDHGIIAAAAIAISGNMARIETFVMSCRVIGRNVETAFLAAIIEILRERGIAVVEADYRPSPKNAISQDLYRSNGFQAAAIESDGAQRWCWAADTCSLPHTPYVDVTWRAQ
ncbi:MAG: HAD-IIIC family phosphatase [Hyphomicrobiaceae bacterium]|nr:MAG: HAD-IIIC family phosphatase [Hyphomicrobiaceae bacterium]